MQWISKGCAAGTALMNFAAAIWFTIIVAMGRVNFRNVTAEQEALIRATWDGKPLVYSKSPEAWAVVAFDWLGVIFVTWRRVLALLVGAKELKS